MERDCRRYETRRGLCGKRLAPAVIPNDGKQTPMRGHPVSWLNMPLAVVAGDASSSGITSQQAGH